MFYFLTYLLHCSVGTALLHCAKNSFFQHFYTFGSTDYRTNPTPTSQPKSYNFLNLITSSLVYNLPIP